MTNDANKLRQDFLRFFEGKLCRPLPSSSLQPPDASTLFTSAGMHQFKPDFMGNLQHKWPDGKPVTRAATVQKCMRTPDLENVGRTARHHTFFEMLGFFSFGDFFKREAIAWIWEFYTSKHWCGLDVSSLHISVYGGDESGAGRDEEAADIWVELLKRPENFGSEAKARERISYLGEHDNFWPAGAPSQGPNGVCGPCSEIFYDLGDEYGQGTVETNGDRFMEIGNIVFTQFERSGPTPGKGVLTPLPAKNIDFGGGFERLVMVEEGAKTTLDTSLFTSIREKLREHGDRRWLKPVDRRELDRQLHKRLLDAVKECKRVGYTPSRFMQMLNEGATQAVQTLIAASTVSDGFTELWQRGRLDLTVEAIVLEEGDQWGLLFDEQERLICRSRLTKYKYEFAEKVPTTNEIGADEAVREKRIADHIRAITFAMSDGILPSNEGAGYVIRRIIRRAFRDGSALVANLEFGGGGEGSSYGDGVGAGTGADLSGGGKSGVSPHEGALLIGALSGDVRHSRSRPNERFAYQPFLHKLVPVIVEHYGDAYPELKRATNAVINTIKQEEQQFSTTLERGLQQLAGLIRDVKESGESVLKGKPAFDLYQSQGLPREVVQDELAAEGLHLDQVGYDEAEEKHRQASKGGKQVVVFEKGWFQDVKAKHAATEFLGYDTCEAPAKIIAIARDGELFDIIEAGDTATIVLDRTPFYGESGGQVGDRGSLVHEESSFEVADTQKRDDIQLHEGKVLRGKLRVGDTVTARVDAARRDKVRSNHSATHLMHAALRTVLGDHVVQRGSEVGPDRLRFDFSHPKGVTFDERQEIERLVNEQIQANAEVGTDVMTPEAAQQAGAMALFGEKYGDKVRVLSMGREGFSKELCGGTHVGRTGDIGYFRIVSEGSSAAGVRRIEAVTGQDAYALAAEDAKLLAQLHGLTKAQPGKVLEKVEGLLKEVKDLKSKAKKGGGVDGGQLDAIRKNAETVGEFTLYVSALDGVEAPELLTIRDALGQDGRPSAVLLGSRGEGRALLLLSFAKEMTARGLHAGKIVGEMAPLVGGKGGGKPEVAQAGGKNPEGLKEALDLGLERIREALKQA